MRTLTGIILIATVLFSSCTKENETPILENQLHTTPTEITEIDLPAIAFEALQEVKMEMASETAPTRVIENEERNSCWGSFVLQGFYNYNQHTCGEYLYYGNSNTRSYGHLYTGNTVQHILTSPPTTVIGNPEVVFETATASNQPLYYWFGVYDYAKGKYAYTKAGWGDISGKHTFDFTPNKWHNSRIVVWAKDNSGQYGWRLVQGLWTMPFSN